jgi:hypothetical protein
MDDEDFSGEDLAYLLSTPLGARIAKELIGCQFYLEDPEDLVEITVCDPRSKMVRVKLPKGGGGRHPLSSGYVILTPGLKDAIDAAMTDGIREEWHKRNVVSAFGFIAPLDREELDRLHRAIECAKERVVPPVSERRQLLDLADRYGTQDAIIKLASAWVEAANGRILPDVLIVLVAALRHAGRQVEALARVDLIDIVRQHIPANERRILLTERAAILADRYEQTREPTFLVRARNSAQASWAIGSSMHCRSVLRRIEALEEPAND